MCDFHHLYAHLLGDICESDYTLLLDSEWHEPEEINPSKAGYSQQIDPLWII